VIANLGISASAVRAATGRHAATAVNVANVSAAEAPRERVDLAEAAVRAGVTSYHRVMDPSGSALVDDMAEMSLTGVLYSANLALLEAQDETAGTLFDAFA
jgi:hypothetical protein